MKISIIIPAYNEEERIGATLNHYLTYFVKLKNDHGVEANFIVVLNGCIDRTAEVVKKETKNFSNLSLIEIKQAGKGLAIIAGFKEALKKKPDLIGFVDADMATSPTAFYSLMKDLGTADGVIASRYMPGAEIFPPRPWIKRIGSRLVFESIVYLLFGMKYYDFQCGAKIFKYKVIKKILPHLKITQWAFDVELLYLCKKYGFIIKEVPTVWYDQEGSKLNILNGGIKMLGAVIRLRLEHSSLVKWWH